MGRVIFVQPAVPKYRVPFFESLRKELDIKIFTTRKDFLGVKTVYKSDVCIVNEGYRSLFSKKIIWMNRLPLFSEYNRGDVVVINGNPRIINYMLLFLILRLRGIKTVWWGHGWTAGSFGLSSKIRIKLMKLLSNYQLLYTDKEKDLLKLSSAYALNNGLDSSLIENAIKLIPSKEKSSRSEELNLVYIGRITEKANFKFLLESISRCNISIKLNVIGASDKIESYKDYASYLNINDKVIWHGAIFDENEIAKIMMKSHAFIYTGAVGLSLIHAYNYGLPAIVYSSSDNHMPEFAAFKDAWNGYSYKMGDVDDLCSVILRFSQLDDISYTKMVENSYFTVSNNYNIDNMVKRFSNMIEDIQC